MKLIEKLHTPQSVLKSRPLYANLRMYLVFMMGGGARFLIVALVTGLLIEVFRFPYTVSYAVGIACAAVSGFIYNAFVTFNTKTAWKFRLLKSAAIAIVINTGNWVLVYALTEALANIFETPILPEYYWAAIFSVSLVLSIANFGLDKSWVFKHP